MARTAVVAGTATAVSNRVSRRQANRWSQQEYEQQQQYEQQAPPPQQYQAPAPPPPDQGEDRIEQLKELAGLKEQGVLTDEEFAREKARILAT
jgi:hypothetical protein